MNCPQCKEVLAIGVTFCECGWSESQKEKPATQCKKEGCRKGWVIDHFCREHYHESISEKYRKEKLRTAK